MADRVRGVALALGGTVLISTDSLLIRAADAGAGTVVFWTGVFTFVAMLAVRRVAPAAPAPATPAPAAPAPAAPAPAAPAPAAVGGAGGPAGLVDRFGPGTALAVAVALQTMTAVLFILAVETTTVANVMVIVAAAPFGAAGWAWVLLRERTATRVWVGTALSGAGILVVIAGSAGGGRLAGDLCAAGAVVGFGLLAVWLRRHRSISGLRLVGLAGLGMAAVSWPWAEARGLSVGTWLTLAAMGLVTVPASRWMLTAAPRYLPAPEVLLFAPVETVLGTWWAYLAFGEQPASRTWIGGAVILAGVAVGLVRSATDEPGRPAEPARPGSVAP